MTTFRDALLSWLPLALVLGFCYLGFALQGIRAELKELRRRLGALEAGGGIVPQADAADDLHPLM